LEIALAGEVVICRLTPNGISQRVIGKLPGATRDVEELLARIDRGEERVSVVEGLYRVVEMAGARRWRGGEPQIKRSSGRGAASGPGARGADCRGEGCCD